MIASKVPAASVTVPEVGVSVTVNPATTGLLLEIEISEQAPWRKVGLEQRPSGSVRGHLATHLNWILRMAQLSRGAHKCADPIDILGAIAAHRVREC